MVQILGLWDPVLEPRSEWRREMLELGVVVLSEHSLINFRKRRYIYRGREHHSVAI